MATSNTYVAGIYSPIRVVFPTEKGRTPVCIRCPWCGEETKHDVSVQTGIWRDDTAGWCVLVLLLSVAVYIGVADLLNDHVEPNTALTLSFFVTGGITAAVLWWLNRRLTGVYHAEILGLDQQGELVPGGTGERSNVHHGLYSG